MNVKQEIKQKLSELVEKKQEMLKLIKDNKGITFGDEYQIWYSQSLKIMNSLGKDRLDEFVLLYAGDPKRKELTVISYGIRDYIGGIMPGNKKFDHATVAQGRLINQFQILNSLATRVDTVLEDVEGHLFTHLQDSELTAAFALMKVNLRASGALAGVVLERYLQRVAINHNIIISKKSPTISDLNDPLKSDGVYDVPTWRKIQLLADIRNICSHQKDQDPSKEQVKELIEGVSSITKSVF